MKTKFYSFLSIHGNLAMKRIRELFKMGSVESYEIPVDDNAESISVIPLELAEEWLDNLPLVLAHQTATNKLSSCQVYGLERRHFEDKLQSIGNIDDYLSRFSDIDPLAIDKCYQMLRKLSVQLTEPETEDGYFLLTENVLASESFRLAVATINLEVGGYNTFSGVQYERNIHDLMKIMGTSSNLIQEKSIIPIRVFSDFVEIQQAADLINEICGVKAGTIRYSDFAKSSDDLDRDRNFLESKLFTYVEKYFCLEFTQLSKLGKTLLAHYTLEPIELIDNMGEDVICFPFEIPESLRLPENERLLVQHSRVR